MTSTFGRWVPSLDGSVNVIRQMWDRLGQVPGGTLRTLVGPKPVQG